MKTLQKCKAIAYGMFAIISALEVMLFCKLYGTTLEDVHVMFFIVSFVLFNGSLWWFRNIYDKALNHYAEKDRRS